MTAPISIVVALLLVLGGWFFYQSGYATPAPSQNETSSAQTSEATTLNRSGHGLTDMPKDILSMTQLQQLDLSNNALTGALPAEIRNLQNLEVLILNNNNMTGLPAELGQLTKLRVLNVADNQLTGIPNELGNLQQLDILNLSGNNISTQDLEAIRSKLPTTTQIFY